LVKAQKNGRKNSFTVIFVRFSMPEGGHDADEMGGF